ncbi:D-hexose-6-phosphate mutarotase [Pseudomonas sp. DTU_2021_1001937_2_SI_NGA_ILE_001]|uniref:D-hexose-6-phosphate mutarotase n=1 Tax=Pseudomonas sp. DTU_2021_1001937_2_SI_NGA_ILE_001 TaxID=3077589 RepID=UPI0028FC31F2|nr:D-hexose-6-phosphate mutarotase [Pseudomonas sp. DTU_2021_1001937_2_SI_NGA_ILE_001]WNW13593.1 D-hexose-6-phosphate mutarotase [Pseudomonas sp. DTU_2021_1001937_2_SI_NGA_ILE_001]
MDEHPLQRFFSARRPRATFEWERYQAHEVLLIDHPRCQAAFSRQGAQLVHFQPRDQKPWLWCATHWPAVGAIRGGVPVCWPWHGRHPEESGWPAHGWARLLNWKLLDSQTEEHGVRLHWRLQLWDWQADLHAELGDTLRLDLSTRHQDSEPCHFSQALHAYWRISDVNEVALQGLDGAPGYDQLRRQTCRQSGELRVQGACEQVFEHEGRVRLQDPGWQRGLNIDVDDSPKTAVWHPGKRPLLGLGGNEVQGFVRVEAAGSHGLRQGLQPGEQARLSLQASLA